jgi:UDPglucose 6-dehydrogenase
LEFIVDKNVKAGRLHFSTSLADNIDDVQVIFSAVGTPPDEDGSAELQYVLEVARTVGRYMKINKLISNKKHGSRGYRRFGAKSCSGRIK